MFIGSLVIHPLLKLLLQIAMLTRAFALSASHLSSFLPHICLLHIHVDEELHFEHVLLASRYVGTLLFSKYFEETLENLKSMLGGGGALADHLFECYAHFLFEQGRDEPLTCHSLDGLHFYDVSFNLHLIILCRQGIL